jgi:heme exporter protein CcmD
MANFFAMGGYAVYVWPAYTATFLVMVAAIALSLQAHARARDTVRRLEDEGEIGSQER